MGDYVYIYQAIQSFDAPNNGLYLGFQKADILEISAMAPYGHLQNRAFLYAFNRRTGLCGYVRVEHIKLLGQEINRRIQHPSEVGIPETDFKIREHKLEEIYVLTPILCKHCKDYIWGQGHIGWKCKDCHACFHAYCARFFANDNCQRDESLPPVTLDYDKPVAEWTSHNVVEWMAALNLYPYSDVFRCKDIKGSDLIHLDREKLIAMGIKDDFHQKAILTCIDELLHKAERKNSTAIEAYEPGPNLYNHNLRQHSFSNLERCDKCNKYLRGVFHQGFLCLECGFVAHRTCAAIGLPSCTRPPLEDNRTPIFQFKSYFGQALCAQFRCMSDCPAPLLLMKFVKELENRAKADETIELYTMYSATPPADQVNKLVKLIDTDLISIDLNLFSPTAITGVIKKYLRELPDPIIPVQWYDKFIEAQKKKNDEECTSILKQLVVEMPDHHKSTLRFMMSHLCRICQMEFARGNKCPPTVLVQVMCHIFLRPPWERIIQVVYNTQAHNRIIELLLLQCDWGEVLPEFASAPAIPPRKVSGRFGRYMEEKVVPLHEAEWYWGNIKREDVNEMLNETIDGTFLVRDSSSKGGEYTLTLRKGGANKLIKICHRDGKYGFTEPYTFTSVVELINNFRNVSLSLYNTSLNIKLLYPVARGTQDDEAIKAEKIDKLVEKLVIANEIFSNKQRVCEQVAKDFNEGFQDVQSRKHALNALKELVKVFAVQSVIQGKFQVEAQPHETKSLELNSGLLKERLKLMQDSCDRLDLILQKKEFYNRVLERRLTCLKPEILNLRRERERYVQWLQKKGYSPHKLSQIINKSDGTYEGDIDLETLPHNDQNTWLIVNCSREEAENMLKDKPDGTFLIRKSTNLYKHVLVVVCNGIVNHCIINETEKGCGFSEPYNIYPSLKDLVLHYATNSLEIHNDLLNTVLKYPIGAPSITLPQLLPPPQPAVANVPSRDIPIAS